MYVSWSIHDYWQTQAVNPVLEYVVYLSISTYTHKHTYVFQIIHVEYLLSILRGYMVNTH